jgi:O-antigen/teichoic acid export membrane protein
LLLTLYGHKYAGAVLVATVAPMLALPKAFLGPIQALFESTDEQNYFLICTGIACFVDVGVAWWLILSHGALGACIGSGAAQTSAVGMLYMIGVRKYKIPLPWRFFARIIAISTVAALAAAAVSYRLRAPWSLIVGSLVAILVFFGLGSFFKMLEPEDVGRFKGLSKSLPGFIVRPLDFVFAHLSRPEPSSSAAV